MAAVEDALHGLRELERTRLEALVHADLATAELLHADDYQLITPGGRALTKRDYLDGIESGAFRYRVFEPVSEVSARACDDLAVLRYLARIEVDFTGGNDAGVFWHTDVYQRTEDQWRALWSQATRTSGPAGLGQAATAP